MILIINNMKGIREPEKKVILKCLNNSQNLTIDFLQEVCNSYDIITFLK